MKMSIENTVQLHREETNFDKVLLEFATIIQNISNAGDVENLKSNFLYLESTIQIKNFKCVIGDYMTVSQLSYNKKETKRQIIFVDYKV